MQIAEQASHPLSDELLTPSELALYCKVALPTVYGWRTRGTGPKAVRVGGQTRYRLSDVEAWLAESRDATDDDTQLSASARSKGGDPGISKR
jgi:excisionase family DNA binding protein